MQISTWALTRSSSRWKVICPELSGQLIYG
jgi:hypothetical protein